MTVHSKIVAVLALTVLGLVAGCGSGERTATTLETDDADFRRGQQLVRQERHAEALAAFLRVIERRGEQASPESHLEAGLIFLNRAKNPIYAIYHFSKYLELQPNAKQAAQVRGLIDTARREYARTLPGRPMESEIISGDLEQRVKDLQREVDDLRSENAGLRALVPAPATRNSSTTVDLGESQPAAPVITPMVNTPLQIKLPEPDRTPVASAPPRVTPPAPAPSVKPNVKLTPARPVATSGRKHTVAAHETLYAISKKYGVTVEAIVAANRDVLPSVNSPLRTGAELKIP